MDVRRPFCQNIAAALAGILFLNPIMAAAAEATLAAANGNTGVTAAGNGVPVVNIATPNGNGLSHNQFSDYNVGQQGLILNNATTKTQSTQLGGIILGNANLQGQAANLILNEVTGGSPSQLQGYTEVAGQQAHVVVANPNGITCNGCGFINTPRATLTTGQPIIEGGRLDRLQVDGGAISIEGQGLNASNIDQFDLITRSAKLNAELHANQLNVITGANDVKVADLAVSKRAAIQESEPQLAIDSSALGGMYAGAIRLVGTEQGVGVKLAGNMAASAGDIQIDASGKLSLAQTAASGNVRIAAESLELNGKVYAGNSVSAQVTGALTNKQSLAARNGISLQAGEVVNQGVIEAGVNADNSRNGVGDVNIDSQRLRNTGTVAASRTLDVAVDGLDNRGGTLSGKAQAQIQADQLDNRQGRLLSQGDLSVQAVTVDNSQSGLVNGQNSLNVQATGLNNQSGEISTQGSGKVTAANLDNRQGTLIGENALQVVASGSLNNSQGGAVSSRKSLLVSAASLDNSAAGTLVSQGALVVKVSGALDNRNAGTLSSKTDLQVATASLSNQGGQIVSEGALNLSADSLDNSQQGSVSSKGNARIEVASLANRSGELLSQGRISLTGQRLDNSGAGLLAANQGIDLQVGQIDNRGGEISSRAAVAISADDLDNRAAGTIIGDAGLRLTVERLLNSALGRLLGRDALVVRGVSLDNSAGGTLSSQQNLDIALSGDLDNSDDGALVSEGVLKLNASTLSNQAGTVSSAGNLAVNVAGNLDNRDGTLVTDGELQLTSNRLDNSAGSVSSKISSRVQTGELINQGGRLVSGTGLTLNAAKLDNRNQGLVAAGSALTATLAELDQRGAGQLVSEGALTLDMQQGVLNNSEQGLLAASGPLLLNNLKAVNNSRGGEISSNGSFALHADSLNNQGGRVISGQALLLRINQSLINSLNGVLSGAEALSLQAASADNAGGTVASRGDIGVEVAGALNNASDGTLSAGGTLNVKSATLDNSAQGLLASGGNLLLDTGAINNRGGQLLSQRELQIAAGDIDNRNGVIGSEQAMQLQAARVDNQAGLINSADSLALTATTLDSSDQGEVSAQQALVLSVTQLIQRQGRLLGGGAVSVDLHGGRLDNRGGLISAYGPLTLANLQAVDNRGGELSSNASFLVKAASIDNGEQGRIISAGTLGLEAATLRNAGAGLLSGWQGLDVKGGSLDNSGKGTLSSRNGALTVALSGALDNHEDGALASQGNMQVAAASLDNSAKGILSTEGQLDLALADKLDNHDQGLISAEGAVAIQARDVHNGAGQIAGHSLLLTGRNLDNSAGQLSSDTTLNLTLLGTLTNTNQAQLASGADLLLRADAVDNRSGTLVSRGLLDIVASSLNNSAGGTLAAQKTLDVALSGVLDNRQDGLIYSLDDQLTIKAGSLNNNAGTLQGKGNLDLEITGILSSQQGRISSGEGNVQVQAASLDNSAAGMLYSVAGWLKLTVAGLINNNGGITQARSLDIQSGDLNNAAGHLSATHGDNRIAASAFNNQGGGLYAGQLLDLTASSFDNQSGKVAAATIDFGLGGALNNSSGIVESASTLRLISASVLNRNGKLRALGSQGDTLIRSGTLDNRLGILESANSNVQLELGSLLNTDGSIQHVGSGNLNLASALATTAGGTLATNGQLSISAQNWVNSGILQAARLLLNVDQFSQTASGQLLASESLTASGGTWSNDGLLASDGTLSLTLTGAYSGSGTLSSLDDLSLTAGNISLATNGRISGGALTTLNSSGAVTNRGRLTSSGDLRISAGSLSNYATLGSGESLRLAASNLLNEYGLIFSGEDMVLRAAALINNQADIYSMGTLSIARDDANGLLSSLENRSGSIESLADMTLRAALLSNRKDSFSTAKNQTYGQISVVCYDCSGDHHNVDYVATERFDLAVAEDSAAASIHSGGNLDIQGSDIVNRYSSLSASGNILINAATLENTGAATGTLEHVRRFNTGRVTDGTDERFRGNYIYPYNAQPLPKEVPDALYRWNLVSDIETSTPTGIASAAIIQAGGNVVIQASQSLSNQSILAHQAPQAGTAQSVATGVSAASQPLQVTLNAQLPPDLAQQQVNPLTLPGFSLPQGDNGLFRLSGQQGESAQQTDVQHSVRDLTLSAPSIAATSFEQSLGYVDAQGSTFGKPGTGSAAVAAVGAAQGQQPIAGGQSLPGTAQPAGAHRYLIETNPELTNLKTFLGSDYLLNLLGYDLDGVQKRLGDGLYEQRLIREAVAARTGQRFLAGLTSDEAMFRYLMDNAIASKRALSLSLGVSLSAAQVAALTHDIVWMEEHEVLGQKVMVPVLYLAQSKGRLAPNGALIQGRDVDLISGGSLTNSGTLRASRDLSATANAIGNSGLMQAGERLSLLATGSIRNTQGGIISGKDVSAIALTGDIINERSITHEARSGRGFSQLTSVVDKAAGIEASNALVLSAGRDIQNIGGRLQAGGDATLSAGRDLVVASAAAEDGSMRKDKRHFWSTTSTTQHGSDVQIGGDLAAAAGQDLAVVASKVKAAGDIELESGRDTFIASAANESSSEYHYKRSGKTVDKENSNVRQQASVVEAGNDLVVTAGDNLTVAASQLYAGDEAYLVAGKELALLSAENQDHSFYFKKKKSSSSKKSQLDETTTVTNVGSTLASGKDAVLLAGQDLRVMGSEVSSDAGRVSLLAGQDVLIGSVNDSTSSRHEKTSSKTSWGGLKSSKVEDAVKETRSDAVGSLVSGDDVLVQAGRDATITGSALVSTDDLSVQAGRDLTVNAAENTFSRSERHKEKKRDLSGLATGNNGGLDDITGKLHLSIGSQKHNGNAEETTLTGSTLGSSEGNVSLTAGRGLKVIASDLISTQDMSLTGGDVTIAAGLETAKQTSKDSSRSLAVGRVIGGAVVDTVDSIRANVKDARNAEDGRLKAVKTAQAALSAYNLASTGSSAAANIADGKPANSGGSLIKIGSEVASTRSKSTSEYSSQTVKQASLTSGDSLAIVATGGATTAGDIQITGSALKADDTLLQAKRNVTLESAQNRSEWNNQNSSNRFSVGASFNIGSQNGFTLDLGAKTAKGLGTGHELAQVNSTLETGSLLLRSGQDTTLAGAQVHAETIKADIGGNLNIASRQDDASNQNRQKSGGVGGSICVPPFCYGATVTASGNIAAGKSSSQYQAVSEQSGLYARQGGYDIHVGQTTRLDGAVIASDATAEKNRLSTDRLIASDIKNRSEVKSQSASISASYSSSGTTKGGEAIEADSGIGGGLPLALKESEHSTTRSAVSAGSIVVRNPEGASDLVGLSRDTANANQALERPDEQALQERMELIQSTVALGQGLVDTVATAKARAAQDAAQKADKSKDPADIQAAYDARQAAEQWKVGGSKRMLADIATGLAAAGLGGAGGSTGLGILAHTTAADTYTKIGDYADAQRRAADKAGDPALAAAWAEGGAARVLLHSLAGAAQGLAGGNAGSSALGAGASAAIMPAIGEALERSGLEKDDRDALATLIAAGVGATAAAGGSTAGQVAAGSSAAGVEKYNRQLHPDERKLIEKQAKELAKAQGISEEEATRRMAAAFAYYTDADWQKTIAGSETFDSATLVHLGIALAPLGDRYSIQVNQGDVPLLIDSSRIYTAAETLRLLQNYQLNHADFYNPMVNAEYLQSYTPDGWAQNGYYRKYLNYGSGLNVLPGLSGTAQGIGAAGSQAVSDTYQLGKGLVGDFAGTSERIANGLLQSAARPDEVYRAYSQAKTEAEAQAFLHRLQGNPEAAARVEAQWETEFALNFVAVSRVGKIGKAASGGAKEAEVLAKARVEINARRDDAQQYDHFRKPDSKVPGGEWDWQKQAPNNGAVPGTQQTVTVQPGGVLDRYGQRGGEYMSPAGTPYEARALPPGKRAEPYEQYPVLKPFTVTQEKIAPAFGQVGGGTQMRATIPEVQNRIATIDDLIIHGYLKDPKK